MSSARPVTVSTPGKLILMGEHAVVYGRPALVAAIDLRLTARFTPVAGGEVHLDLPGLAHTESLSWDDLRAYAAAVRERWDGYARQPGAAGFRAVRGEDPAHVVKVALGEAVEGVSFLHSHPEARDEQKDLGGGKVRPPRSFRLETRPQDDFASRFAPTRQGLSLRIDSDLPIGSGFGSSAATATAVIAGCLLYHGHSAEPAVVEKLALEVERRQHGLPSGVDGATVLYGGVLWARKLPDGSLERERIAVRSPLLDRLRVYDTGTPSEPTGAVVAAVRERRDRDPAAVEAILDRMEAATRAFRAVIESGGDPDQPLHLIREHEACLEHLGAVPEETRAVIRRIEGEGGAAKISGAGSLRGPGAGSLLVYDPDPERIAGWEFLRPFPFYPVHLGAPGFREENSG